MKPNYEPVKVRREVPAIQIPYGEKHVLAAGAEVVVVQKNPSNFTVQDDRGRLLRVEGKDADALGLEVPAAPAAPTAPAEGALLEQLVWNQLKLIYDPEIPVNIVDLGLIYEVKIVKLPDGGHKVDVKMSMTAPGCSMGDVLSVDAREGLLSIPGVKEAAVEVVFDPPWNASMMTEAARLQLGML